MNSILHLVGIAKKAGRLEIGEEPVGGACRARQAKLILLACDAAENSMRRARHFADGGDALSVVTPLTKAELGAAVGRSACAMLAVTDTGLAAAMAKKLATDDAAQYGALAARMETKANKVLQRQKEQRAHEKNVREGGKRPWAPPTGGKAAANAPVPGAARPNAKPSATAQNALAASARIAQKQTLMPKGRITIQGKLPAGLKKTP